MEAKKYALKKVGETHNCEELKAGDALIGNNLTLLVIRQLRNNGFVLGVICPNHRPHLNKVIDDVFFWSSEHSTLVNQKGVNIGEIFDTDFKVLSDVEENLGIAKKSNQVPITADYPHAPNDDEAMAIIDKHLEKIKVGTEVLRLGGKPILGIRRALEIIGISMTDEEACELSTMIGFSEILTGKSTSEIHHKAFLKLLSRNPN